MYKNRRIIMVIPAYDVLQIMLTSRTKFIIISLLHEITTYTNLQFVITYIYNLSECTLSNYLQTHTCMDIFIQYKLFTYFQPISVAPKYS